MRKLTVAERREKELRFATEKYNIPYEDLKHLMNRFYRLNGDLERLSYLENDSNTCNRRSTKNLSESTDRRSEKLSTDFGEIWFVFRLFFTPCNYLRKGKYKNSYRSVLL